MKTIGYARVSSSTHDQTHDLQIDALNLAGCDEIFLETASGAKQDRPVLAEVLARMAVLREQGEDVTLVAWKLDRLARSLSHLLTILEETQTMGAGFRSLTESIDVSTAMGRLLVGILGSVSAFERDLAIERSVAGQIAARSRGRHPGRPKSLSSEQLAVARSMRESGEPVAVVCRVLGVSRSALYRALVAGEAA